MMILQNDWESEFVLGENMRIILLRHGVTVEESQGTISDRNKGVLLPGEKVLISRAAAAFQKKYFQGHRVYAACGGEISCRQTADLLTDKDTGMSFFLAGRSILEDLTNAPMASFEKLILSLTVHTGTPPDVLLLVGSREGITGIMNVCCGICGPVLPREGYAADLRLVAGFPRPGIRLLRPVPVAVESD